jgi:Ca2+-binding RTX toxin-like protein
MQITVNTNQGLISALRSAQSGDTILLSAGNYSAIGLQGVNFAGPGVTIASADAAHPVTVAGVELSNCSGLTFRDLEVTINSRLQNAFNVAGSSNIHLDGLDVHGATGGVLPGLMFRNSSNVSVTDTQFHDLGTAVCNMNSTGVTISDNRFKDLRGDGIQTTGSSNVTIDGNHFTDFHTAPGDHPDAIQFFTLNQTAAVHDIVITDNVVVRGAGDIVQGIFLGNEIDMPYVDVTISGNKIIGAMYNGIAVGVGQNVNISGNIVQAYADQDSWIIIEHSSNATIANNQTLSLITSTGNTGLSLSGNTTLAATSVGDVSILDHTPPPPVVVTPPPEAVTPPLADPVAVAPAAPAPTAPTGSGSHAGQQSTGTDLSDVPQSVLQKVAGSTAQVASGRDLKGSVLHGSDGGDTLTGAGGQHELYGAAGNDSISGGEGRGYLRGEDGSDTIVGGSDFDDIHGNIGEDSLSGGAGDDWVVGGQGDDRLSGDGGRDLVYGNIGNDSVGGGGGDDIVRGGQGADTVSGGDGDDWLAGDRGSDLVFGGAGADTFHFFADAGTDVVKDFNANEGDRVQLAEGSVYDLAQVGSDTVISIHGGGQMILEGVNLSTLKSDWLFGA